MQKPHWQIYQEAKARGALLDGDKPLLADVEKLLPNNFDLGIYKMCEGIENDLCREVFNNMPTTFLDGEFLIPICIELARPLNFSAVANIQWQMPGVWLCRSVYLYQQASIIRIKCILESTVEGSIIYVSLPMVLEIRRYGTPLFIKDAVRYHRYLMLGSLLDKVENLEAFLDPALGPTKRQIRAEFEECFNNEFNESKLTPDQLKLHDKREIELWEGVRAHPRLNEIFNAEIKALEAIFNLLVYIKSGNPDFRTYTPPPQPTTKKAKALRRHERQALVPMIIVGYNWKKLPNYSAGAWECRSHVRMQPYGPRDNPTRYDLIVIPAHVKQRKIKSDLTINASNVII